MSAVPRSTRYTSLAVNGFPTSQHFHETRDQLRPRLQLLGGTDTKNDGVSIGAVERLIEAGSGRVQAERIQKIFRRLGISLGNVSVLPPPVTLCGLDLRKPGRPHASFRH